MKKLMFTLAVAGMATMAHSQVATTTTSYPNGVVVREVSQMDVPTDRYKVETNKFWDNWFISFGGGAQVLFGDYSSRGDFDQRIAPTANLAVGKWFTPGLGLRLQASGLQAKTFNIRDTQLRYGNPRSDADGTYYKDEFKYLNLHGDILFNVTGMLSGYSENRVYEFIPYVGLGWNHTFDDRKVDLLAWNFGIINTFHLSSAWDFNLELQGMLTEDRFDGNVQGKPVDLMLGATIGFAYKFPQRGFRKSPDVASIVALSQAQLDAVNAALAQQVDENDRLKSQLANRPKEVVNEKVVVKTIPAAGQSVFFHIGSAKLNDQDEVNLKNIAEMLNSNSSANITLTGYADSDTGSEAFNKDLSERRANAVADALVEMGVSRSRIQTVGMGGVDTLVPPSLNRRVMIDVK